MKLAIAVPFVLLGSWVLPNGQGDPPFASAAAKAAHAKYQESLQRAGETWKAARARAQADYLRGLGGACKAALEADDLDEALLIRREQKVIEGDLKSAA